jgi:hypothetical protein
MVDPIDEAVEAMGRATFDHHAAKPNGSAAPQAGRQEFPADIDRAVFHGPLGQAVGLIEPQTEVSPVAILIQTLVMFGSAAGRGAYVQVEADRHHTNLFACVVGDTSRGRKGTSYGRSRQVLAGADDDWADHCTASGLSSGEGLIWCVRDPITKRNANGEEFVLDEGIDDKRLLIYQSEIATAFKVMAREGNTLSPVIRDAWDARGTLAILTKNSPATSTGAHISILGHVTRDELLRHLATGTEVVNGFANRFLFALVKRVQVLPFGGEHVDLAEVWAQLSDALTFAAADRRVELSPAARDMWIDVYPKLTDEAVSGMYGAATARGAPITLRMALIYCLADQAKQIELPHLEAALAIWYYSDESARIIFGDAVGDPVADVVLSALRARKPQSLTRTDISGLLGRHVEASRIQLALDALIKADLVERWRDSSKAGRATELWRAQ